MTARALMFMGTGSDVGKSLIVAGLCRLLANRGLHPAPFKPQNMSNNAAATPEGGEIGRAQALQARAARLAPSIHMNPVLLKPESETGAQVIVQGRREATLSARAFFEERQRFLPAILHSFRHLARHHDYVLVEGAGSPAETNLRDGDLANMGFAAAANLPAILIGDIHRGGVIASIAGTHAVLDSSDRDRIKGFIINKLHGDPQLFSEGRNLIAARTGWPCLGIVPHFPGASRLPAEDALALENSMLDDGEPRGGGFHICVFRLPRIANFDDIDPLRLQPGLRLSFIKEGESLPADCGLAIIPGSKSTIADLGYFRAQGWDIDLAAHIRRRGHVLGLCGGYQMLGRRIHDPDGLEGPGGSVNGLGHLDVETTLVAGKTIRETKARHVATDEALSAYEIHLGESLGPDCTRPFAITGSGHDGAVSKDGRISGTYLHGCFSSDSFRNAYLRLMTAKSGAISYDRMVDETLDGLAAHLEAHIDVECVLSLATPVSA